MNRVLAWTTTTFLSLFMVTSTANTPTPPPKKTNPIKALIQRFALKRCESNRIQSFPAIKKMLTQSNIGMSPEVVSKVMTTLKCAHDSNTVHNQILTVIDYAKPSNQKRLWVFDLREHKLLFHTYVAHGITSGEHLTQQFSNQHNSKASSLGVYKTNQSYYGRHGLSLRLKGLEAGFNDHAEGRAIVMHSAWYVNKDFIEKYGRPGRSWGCPAIAKHMKKPVINAIKENGLLVVYYPGEQWVKRSKYLNCQHFSSIKQVALQDTHLENPTKPDTDILFVSKNHNDRYEENEPVVVMSADNYIKTFHTNAPLLRMLRCQVNDEEYIALSHAEFEQLAATQDKQALQHIFFMIPQVKNARGYWKTYMKFVNLGQIQSLNIQPDTKTYTVLFTNHAPVALKTNHRFIRWIGL